MKTTIPLLDNVDTYNRRPQYSDAINLKTILFVSNGVQWSPLINIITQSAF